MDHPKQDLIMRSTSLDNHYVYVASSISWISYLRNSRTTPSLNSTVKRERQKIGLALGRSFLQEEEAHSLDDIRFSSSLARRIELPDRFVSLSRHSLRSTIKTSVTMEPFHRDEALAPQRPALSHPR